MPKIYELIGKKEKYFKPDGSRWPELVGIELELENVVNAQELPYWQVKQDNSLRNGVEYVLDAPYGGATLQAALDAYYGANLRFENTIRTSTHIHVNVLDTELDAVRAMTMFMYMIEDGLYNVIEADRKWSGYSMPLSEMSATRLRQILSAPYPEEQRTIRGNLAPARNQERYYGFNLAAANKYGTVEFRYFPGGPSRHELESWIDFCLAVKKYGIEIGAPLNLVDRINNEADIVNILLDKLPGEWGKRILEQCPAEQMLARFNEVAALVTDYVIERREPMVFLTTALFRYVGKKLVNGDGLLYLEKLKPLGVLNAGEWDYHLEKAMAGAPVEHKEVLQKPRKPQRTIGEIVAEGQANARADDALTTYFNVRPSPWDMPEPPRPTTIDQRKSYRDQINRYERQKALLRPDDRLRAAYDNEIRRAQIQIERLEARDNINPFNQLVDENGDIE